jgi:hypothetical protein
MNKEKYIRISEFNLKNINSWIKLADNKASFILTISLALFSISFSSIPSGRQIISTMIMNGSKIQLIAGIVLVLMFIAYFAFAILGIKKLISIITPRTISTTKRKSIIYFGSIVEMELEKYKKEISNLTEDQIIDELSDQVYNNAMVASKKYKDVEAAIGLLKIAGLLGITFIVILLFL